MAKMHAKHTANVSVCHISVIFTPSVRLFKMQRLLGDLHLVMTFSPMMYIFPDAASTWGDAYSHRLMCDNPGTRTDSKCVTPSGA